VAYFGPENERYDAHDPAAVSSPISTAIRTHWDMVKSSGISSPRRGPKYLEVRHRARFALRADCFAPPASVSLINHTVNRS